MDFNQAQMTALEHRDGPMMVLAGPGSGKTTVITHRIKRLLEAGVDPSGILVITFTKAAATEMKERFLRLAREEDEKRKQAEQRAGGSRMGTEKPFFGTADPGPRRREACGTSLEAAGSRVSFGTFHSVFYHILTCAYRFPAGNVISGEEKRQYFKKFLDESEMEVEDEAEFISSIINEISYVKGERLDLKYYYSQNCPEEWFKKLYDGYDEMLKTTGKIDFDDMLVMCHELFTERKDILAAWQKKFKYILVDEFQDINLLQYQVVRMLALPENNLFIVGDDDQSIYRFRGSKPEIMLGFQKIYPQAKIVNLEVNYRCEPPIVEAAMRLIAHNEERFPKKIRAGKSGKQKVRFQYFEDCYKENAFLAEDIRQTVQNGVPLLEIAVLFRTNMQPRALMEYMVSANLAFQTKDRIPDIYEHWIARDFFTYIRIAQGSDSRADFLSIMNRPKRYIGRDSLPDETVCFDEWMKLYEEQPWIAERIEKLWYDLKHLSRLSPYAAINYIRRGIGYDDYLAEYAEYRNANKEDFYEVADEILASAKGYRTFEEWFAHIEEYRQELKRLAQEKRRNQNAVTFATLHSAKGLEFTKVYLIDVNEGVMPYKKAVLKQDVEEERRLFYVGMTRAKESLTICSVKKMRGKEVELSRFIKEAGKEP